MANDKSQTQAQESNGSADLARLAAHVEKLQSECHVLRRALSKAEEERDLYLKAVNEYERARLTREFEDVDIASLEAMSAGPVEMIE